MEHPDRTQTVEWLRPSMPKKGGTAPLPLLLRIALAEARPGLFALALTLALLAGIFAARLAAPLTCTFCSAPLPLFLLYFRYFRRGDARVRELEKTFRFSFFQMYVARFTVLFLGAAAALLLLCLITSLGGSAGFLTLALCGAASSSLLGGALLLLALRERAGLIGGALWMGLCVPALSLSEAEPFLNALPRYLWLIPILTGAIMSAAGIRKGGYGYVCV